MSTTPEFSQSIEEATKPTPYEEALAIRREWKMVAEAEYFGFFEAGLEKEMHTQYTDEYLQQRWETGYADGMAILAQIEGKRLSS